MCARARAHTHTHTHARTHARTHAHAVALGFVDAYVRSPLDFVRERALGGVRADTLVLQKRIGQGSFGAVYTGLKLKSPTEQSRAAQRLTEDDPCVDRRVIIKQGLTAKLGARELADTEVWMNRRARRSLSLSRVCAPFVGAFEVGDESGAGGLARGATVLVWEYEGERTLESFLTAPDWPYNLEVPLFGREQSGSDEERALRVVRTVLAQVLDALATLHATGIVHRGASCARTAGGRAIEHVHVQVCMCVCARARAHTHTFVWRVCVIACARRTRGRALTHARARTKTHARGALLCLCAQTSSPPTWCSRSARAASR